MEEHLFIVFGVEHYNTLGLIRSLGSKGIAPILIAIRGKARVASTSRFVSQYYLVDNQEEGFTILQNEYANEKVKPFLYCIDDKTMEYLDARYEFLSEHFFFFNAGEKGRIQKYMDKSTILDKAQQHGLSTLKSFRVKRGDVPKDISYPIITKSILPTLGGWKSDVYICHDEGELVCAYNNIKADTVLVQQYIHKKNEYALEGISVNHGKSVFFGVSITYNYLLPNYYSPYLTVHNADNAAINQKLSELFADIGFEGLFEVEFLIDQDGTYYFSEINFRSSPWGYTATVADMNLPYLWAEGMLKGTVPENAEKKMPEAFTAVVEPIDYQKRVIEQGLDIKSWVADVLDCKCRFYYSKDDLEPFFEMLRNQEKLR